MTRIRIASLCLALCLLAPLAAWAQKLPPDIASGKTIRVALNADYPPLELRDPKTNALMGFDIDLGEAMAKVLGVKLDWQDGAFEQMSPSLQSGRVDMVMSGFYDLPKRRGNFDFIDYLRAGGQFYVPNANADIKTPADLCGKTVTTSRGTNFPDTTKAWSDKNCVAAGKPPMTIITDTDLGQQLSNLKQGRAAGAVQGLEAVPTIAAMDDNGYHAIGEPFSSTLMGIAFTKADPTLRDAVAYALKQTIADGTYAALIKKWKLDLSSYTEVSINMGPAPLSAPVSVAPASTEAARMAEELDIARLRHARPRHYGRMLAVALIIAFVAFIVVSFARGRIDWRTSWDYLFWPTIMRGLVNTVWLSIASMALGIVLGVLCAVGRGSPNPVLRAVAMFYAWFFRGTPVILQLLIWFNLALVFPRFGIPGLWHGRTVDIITPEFAALVGLGLNEGAYISEIVRAGMIAVDRGQYEAAQSIGMSYLQALRRIIMPQAMRVVIPPLGNEFIGLLKTSSLASIIGFSDLLRNSQDIYYNNAKVIELLMVAGLWYLVVVSVASVGQVGLERRFGRGYAAGSRR